MKSSYIKYITILLVKIIFYINKPDRIIMEGIVFQDTNQVTLEQEETTIILQYNDKINGKGLFSDLTNIIEVDLSGCSFIDMASMFSECTFLTSINFSGVDTSSVQDFCNLFNNCKSLISIDLSNSDLSHITDFRNVFKGCQNLEFINLGNAYDESRISDDYTILLDEVTASDLVICLNREKALILYNSLSNGLCNVVYCENDWKKNY